LREGPNSALSYLGGTAQNSEEFWKTNFYKLWEEHEALKKELEILKNNK
jgi:hypothetical protein